MTIKGKWFFSVAVLLLMLVQTARATDIADIIKSAGGARCNGTVVVSWPSFTTSTQQAIPQGSQTFTITNGLLRASLQPYTGYTAVYTCPPSSPTTEYWSVPDLHGSTVALTIQAIKVPTLVTGGSGSGTGDGNATQIQGRSVDATQPTTWQALIWDQVWKPATLTAGHVLGAEDQANKGVANGYAGLDSNGLIPLIQLPSVPYSQISGKPSTFNPATHASTHASAGSDPVTPASIGAEPVDAHIVRTDGSGNLAIGAMVLDPGPEGTCTSALRGHIVTTNGAGGVADQRRVCTKAADGTYSWTVLGTGGGGSGVPYTGATGDVDLGANKITASQFVATAGGANSGITCWSGLTSGRICASVADVAGTEIVYLYPSTSGAAGQVLTDSGSTTCPTLPSGYPATCHQMLWANAISNGTTLPATCSVGAQYMLTAQYSGTGFNYYPGAYNCLSTNTWIMGGNLTTTGNFAMFPPGSGNPGYVAVAAAFPSATLPLYVQFQLANTVTISGWAFRISTASVGNYIGANIYDSGCNRLGPATSTGAATSGSNYPGGSLSMTLSPGTYYLALWASSTTPTFYYMGDNIQSASSMLSPSLNLQTTTKRFATGANAASQTGGTITWPSSCGTLTAVSSINPFAVLLSN